MEILNLTANCGNKETILKGINQLTRENYIEVVNDYILSSKNKKDMSSFEKEYVRALDHNLFDLGRELLKLEHATKTRDELMEIVIDWGISGPYSFESHIDNYELSEFIKMTELDAKTKFDAVISFMKDQLDKYCAEIEKSNQAKIRARQEKELEDYKRTLKHYQDKIAELEKALK